MLDPAQRAIAKYKHLPSVLLIESKISSRYKFSFPGVSKTDVGKEIENINPKKITTRNNTTPRILNESHTVSSNFLQKLVNDAIISGKFPDNPKLADVTPVFKKKNPLDKTNYRLVSVLRTISKIFEKIMEKKLNHVIQNHLSPYLCGHRKSYST